MKNNHSAVDELFKQNADDTLFQEYSSFLQYDTKVISSTIATCKAALQIFGDENVAKVTSFDSINMEDFRKKKVALYINVPTVDQRYYSVLTNILAEQLFTHLFSKLPAMQDRDVFIILDEASQLRLPSLAIVAANIRKYRGALLISVQQYRQLVRIYSADDAAAILSNCAARLYFTGQSLETARELEAILGRTDYEDEEKRKHTRALMTADEIRCMPPDRALLICTHHKPIKVRLYPYYQNRKFRKYSEMPPLLFTEQLPFSTVPVFPLSKFKPQLDEQQTS